MIQAIEPKHFRSLKLAADAIVLDVRAAREQYEEGQIPGNLRIEFGPGFENELSSLEKNKRYLVYCRSGNRSMQACQAMSQMGFKELYSLDGGINKWKETFSN